MSGPTADVSVRVASSFDAPAIAALQIRAWQVTYAGVLPAEALPSDTEQIASVWEQALARPGDARNRVLVALDRTSVVGFAVTCPSPDPDSDPVVDGEISEFVVDPQARSQGHGSRLLQAAADTLVADRFTRAVFWTMAGDDNLRTFLTEAGWGTDGAHRELDLDGTGSTRVKQVRLHTALGD